MEDSIEKMSLLEKYVDAFAVEGVQFLIVGGQAETLYGSARVVYDVTLCYRRTAENLERLARALARLKPIPRGWAGDLKFAVDAPALALGATYAFDTIHGPLDLVAHVSPLGGYDDVVERAVDVELGPCAVKVLALEDLIHMRAQSTDRDSLMHLLAIRRVRKEQGGATS
jgi:hypothetical protein